MLKIKENFKYYTLIDFLFTGYLFLLSILLVFFHRGVEKWSLYIIIHFIIILLIIYFVPVLEKTEKSIFRIIRWWYPIFLFTFNYKEINAFTHILVPGWLDQSIINFEKTVFGGHLSLYFDKISSPLLTEFMKFDYFTYYLMIPVAAYVLYRSSDRKKYVRYLSTVCLAFYISYIGFILYPVRGPRYVFYDKYVNDYDVNIGEFYGPSVEKDVSGKRTKALKGFAITGLQDYIMKYGSLHGGCMPSSHIAVAFVCMMMMYLFKRKIFFIYLPFVCVLNFAVVYNRYHYITDAIAGLLVGLLSLFITPRLLKLWEKAKEKIST